jgi:hypothetical protein
MPQPDPSAIQPLSVKYERDKAIIRLTHEVTNDKIFSLCDEIDLAMQRSAIEETDERLTRQLARYIMDHKIGTDGVTVRTPKPTLQGDGLEFEDVQVRNEDALAAVYADLAAYDVFITPEIAVAMHLIDRTGELELRTLALSILRCHGHSPLSVPETIPA